MKIINTSTNNEAQECIRCLYDTNHPLGLVIDDEGICSGCRIHEEKDVLDWNERLDRLKNIVREYKSRQHNNYDCIVPVSGGNDSYFIVHIVKNILKLNPLLVTYNKFFNTPLGIRNLANLRIKFNCDILIQNINPKSVKKITRKTLIEFGSMYWPCLAGQSVYPVQTAARYKVPLIIWGAHQGIEQVGMYSHEHEVEMTRRYRKDHDLMGYEADDIISIFHNILEEDIWQFRYPDDKTIQEIGIRGIYLGNYIRWDPKAQHEEMIKLYDYQSTSFNRTFDTYDHVDCFNYMNIHDELKFYKHGYSKVKDHASREIRHGRISRDNALRLVRSYQKGKFQDKKLFADWLEISEESLQFILDQHRNPNFWKKTVSGSWRFNQLNTKIPNNKKNTTTFFPKKYKFLATSNINLNKEAKYITIGKGIE